jgi:hypothetical protein
MTIDATQKIIDFLNKYCDRIVSTGCDYYHLQIGGITCDYTLHVDGNDWLVEGSEEDIAILNQQS